MITIYYTAEFDRWRKGLRDRQAIARIAARLLRAEDGNLGETRSLGGGLHEMKIDHGPGYRLYFIWRGTEVIVLLAGGDKRTQDRDIERARRLAQEQENGR